MGGSLTRSYAPRDPRFGSWLEALIAREPNQAVQRVYLQASGRWVLKTKEYASGLAVQVEVFLDLTAARAVVGVARTSPRRAVKVRPSRQLQP